MTVWHGGEVAVSEPDLLHSRKEAFFDGFASKAQTIERLRLQSPNLQICLRTSAALSVLKFMGSEAR